MPYPQNLGDRSLGPENPRWRRTSAGLPPVGCEWVRVGSDALLVDIWTGEVLSVEYGLFW